MCIIDSPVHRIAVSQILCMGLIIMKRELLQLAMGLVMIFSLWFLMRHFLYFDGEILSASTMGDTGYLVVIDPGHGGVDPGMLGVNNTVEKEINLQISYKLKEKMEEHGIHVLLTRETDDGLYEESDRNKKIADMKKRCGIIAKSNADVVISIHQNSFSDSAVCGGQVFYYKHSVEGQKLAQCIQDAFKEQVDETNDRKIKPNDSYYMLIHTPCPTAIVECGFITNYDEAALLVTEEYQEKVAQAITSGVVRYMEEQ